MSTSTATPPARLADPERLRVLTETGLLDGPAVEVLDRLTSLATRVTGAPVALVSLVDAGRQFFVSAIGLAEPWKERRQTPLTHSFCQYVVAADAPLVITDARADDLLCTNLAVPELGVIAYAGFPLRSPDGQPLGSFCVIDTKPREWSLADQAIIGDLAAAAQSEIAVRLNHAGLLRVRTELEHERTFLASLLDSLDAGVAACDADGRLVLRNRVLRAEPDLEAEDMTRESWADQYALYAADGITPLAREDAPLTRALAGEVVHHSDFVVRRPGRPLRHLQANAQPIRAADGVGLGAVVVLQDVTTAVRMERLREVQQAVATAVADAPSAAEAAVRTVSTVAAGLGWTHGEYLQLDDDGETLRPMGCWTTPELESTGHASGAEPLAARVCKRSEPVWTPSGDPAAATALALPVRSGERTLGVLVFLHDDPLGVDDELLSRLDSVSAHLGRFVERRRAEAARRAFERVVAGIDDYVWTVEITTDGTSDVLYASPNGAAVFGTELWTPEGGYVELADLVDPRDAIAFTDFYRAVMDGRSSSIEARFTGAGGTRWIWVRAIPRLEDGRLFVDGICSDVSERHRISDQRDELTALVTHELRSPITSIRGYVELILDDEELSPQAEKFLRIVERRAADLQRLTDDLLDLARMDAGEISIERRPVSLSRLVGDVVTELGEEAAAKGLAVDVDADDQIVVTVDPDRFRQVLANVVSNAVKYTPPGGTITIRSRLADGVATVSVADTGIGIPADQYARLFDRFFRTSSAVRLGVQGTGLGLAITKAIMEQHGGMISAQPGDPEGTVFTIRLPGAE